MRCRIGLGSWIPALLWGVAFANVVRGLPIDAAHQYTGGFFNLLNPYALLGGVTTLLAFLTTVRSSSDSRPAACCSRTR